MPIQDVLGCAFLILKEWQTLIASIIAIGVAYWTIKTQITQSNKERNETAARKRFAARAGMPDALSDLCTFTSEVMKRLDGRSNTVPEKPKDSIDYLKAVIEFIDTSASERVFELTSFYQVHNARFYEHIQHPKTHHLDERKYDVVRLRCMVHSLFGYARNEEDESPTPDIGRDDIISALRQTVGLEYYVTHEEIYAGVVDIINRRHPN